MTNSPGRVGNALGQGFQESSEVFPVRSSLSDGELASFPCAWSTAEGMLERAGVCAGEQILITGASCGVGSAAVQLDVRTLYLKDLSFFGATWQPGKVFENLIRYIEQGEIRPLVAKTYPLADIVRAQQDFMAKGFAGKLVLLPGV